MKVYLASGLENFANVRMAAERLRALGHEIAYDWTTHGDVRQEGAKRMREVSQNEASAVMGADAVMALLPGGRGTHTEVGLAIAGSLLRGTPKVYLYCESEKHFQSDENTCAFYFHPCVTRLSGSLDAAIDALIKGGQHG